MSVPYTNFQRSVPMTEAEAKAIAAKTHLFGYAPDCYQLRGSWHLTICSDGDVRTVETELAALRSTAP